MAEANVQVIKTNKNSQMELDDEPYRNHLKSKIIIEFDHNEIGYRDIGFQRINIVNQFSLCGVNLTTEMLLKDCILNCREPGKHGQIENEDIFIIGQPLPPSIMKKLRDAFDYYYLRNKQIDKTKVTVIQFYKYLNSIVKMIFHKLFLEYYVDTFFSFWLEWAGVSGPIRVWDRRDNIVIDPDHPRNQKYFTSSEAQLEKLRIKIKF